MVPTLALSIAVAASPTTRFVDRPDGRVAYELLGESGPLVVCVPGMGDLRSQYRLLAPRLVASGYRVAMMDLRGLGESSTSFTDYSASAVGGDVVALLRELKEPRAWVMGNSMAAAAAVWAAAELPDVVAGVVLLGPFARDVPAPFFMPALVQAMFAPPWGPGLWSWYYARLYPQRRPADLASHRDNIRANLRQSGRHGALLRMLKASKSDCWDRADAMRARSLVIMGSEDPDFDDPRAEATVVSQKLRGSMLMVEGSGHYPHVDSVDTVADAVIAFVREDAHGA